MEPEDNPIDEEQPTKEEWDAYEESMKTKFLTGKDYPWLCSQCQQQIDLVVGLMDDLPDTDDEEGPCMYVYDNAMFCGGTECKNRIKRPEDGLSPKDFTFHLPKE